MTAFGPAWLLGLACLAACGSAGPRPAPPNADTIMIDHELVVRREHDGAVSVLATATLDGVSAPGWVRIHGRSFETAATSVHAELARARAWQVLIRMVEHTPERAYEAAVHGVRALRYCAADRWRAALLEAADLRDRPDGAAPAARLLRELLDTAIRACVRKHHGVIAAPAMRPAGRSA